MLSGGLEVPGYHTLLGHITWVILGLGCLVLDVSLEFRESGWNISDRDSRKGL